MKQQTTKVAIVNLHLNAMKGYLIFPGIFAMLITVGLFYPTSIYVYMLLILFLFRLGHTRCPHIIGGTLVCGLLVFSVGYFKIYQVPKLLTGDETHLQVHVPLDGIKVDGDSLRLKGYYETDSGKEWLFLFYSLSSEEEQHTWKNQTKSLILEVEGTLELPESNRNRHQFNYQEYLNRQGIHWVMKVNQIKNKVAQVSNWWEFHTTITQFRIQAIQTLHDKLDQHALAYVVALVIGNSDFMEQDHKEIQQQLGIVPLFVISGLHINLLCQFLYYILLRIGITKEKSKILLLVFLLVYGQFVGFGVSVMRVVLMKFFGFVGELMNRRFATLDYFFLALIVSLIHQPQLIVNIGFQLSYGVTALFLLFESLIRPLTTLKKNIALSFFASVFSAPILAFHFFEIPIFSVVFNCLLLPLFEWVLIPICFVLFLVGLCFSTSSLLFIPILQLSSSLFHFLEDILVFFSNLPYLTFVSGRLSFFTIVIYFILFFVMLTYFFDVKKLMYSCSKIMICCMLILFGSIQMKNNRMSGEVMMIDVGQGDAILIRLPNHQGDFLIDTGGQITYEKEAWKVRSNEQSLAKRTLIPYLKSEGITKLDAVFITHAHLDHFGALEELSDAIQIDEVVFPKGSDKNGAFSIVLKKLRQKGILLTPILAGATYEKNTFLASILFPFEVETGGNNDSLVLYTKLGTASWLFVGDLEKEGEAALLAKYPQLKVDILKIGHHGSKTSSSAEFIEQLKPADGLISCGKKNRFDHPHEITMKQLERNQVTVYRTDLQGAIYLKYSTNQQGDFQTMLRND